MNEHLISVKQTLEQLQSGYFLEIGQFGLGDFICFDNQFREDLLKIVDGARNYIKRKERKRPLNIYIEAQPGTGKSFLVKQVCTAVNKIMPKVKLKFLNYNMTYIDSPEQIINSFRKVQDSNLKGEIPIIFFDEIDSKMGGIKDTYPYFLTAMYDGVIYDAGEEWKLGDAIFFFAASKLLKDLVGQEDKNHSDNDGKEAIEDNGNQNGEAELTRDYSDWIGDQRGHFHKIYNSIDNLQEAPKKLKDFFNRIDVMIFLPPSNVIPNNSRDQANQQAHYLAVSLILKHFPYIRLVDSEALSILAWDIIRADSNRQIERYIFNSSVPSNERFSMCHLPDEFLNRPEVQNKLEERSKKFREVGKETKLIPIGRFSYE